MFTSSASLFFDCTCSVGGGCFGNPPVGRLHGMGCLLAKDYVLTAAHCWTDVMERYDWPAVATLDGLFRCDVAFHNEEADILLLRLAELVQESRLSLNQPERYAQLGDDQLFLGTQVGFMSQLTLHDTSENSSTSTHFSAAFVSMWLRETDPPRFALSGTVIQQGFSGSPVFLPSGLAVGVLVQSLSFRADLRNPNAPIYILPVISPIRPMLKELRTALNMKHLS
jgi:hypothetical protein